MLYYMLNPKDITECYGIVDDKDVMDELNITKSQFKNLLKCQYDYYHNSILVEVAPDVDRETNDEKFDEVLFYTSKRGMRYYACSDCTIKRISKTGNVYIQHLHKSCHYKTSIDKKTIFSPRVFAKCFIKPDLNDDEVVYVDGELKLENIKIYKKRDFLKKVSEITITPKIGYYEDGKLVKVYDNARDASKDLYYTYRYINMLCSSPDKVKNPSIDVRYIEG